LLNQLLALVIASGALATGILSGWLGARLSDPNQTTFTFGDTTIPGGIIIAFVYAAVCFVVVIGWIRWIAALNKR